MRVDVVDVVGGTERRRFRPLDPCLVVVTEDGYWIEVDRWFD
jgi:hypothetical protein